MILQLDGQESHINSLYQEEPTSLLLDSGADVHAIDSTGPEPFAIAVACGLPGLDVVSLLLEYGVL